MHKTTHFLPQLVKAYSSIKSDNGVFIGYYKIDTSRNCYICCPSNSNRRVLLHVFVHKSMIISAGDTKLVVKMQEILPKRCEVATGLDVLEFVERVEELLITWQK